MLLSIIIPGKNDNFRSSNSKVIKFNIENSINNIKKMNIDDVEIVLCDWGSEEKIIDSIVSERHNNFKCVYVPPNITEKYNDGSSYSIVHPLNTSFRNSIGEYVIFWDSDCFLTDIDFKNLYAFVKNMKEKNDMSFYWGSRKNVPYENYSFMQSSDELEKYLKTNPKLHEDSMINNGSFGGCGISMLMNRMLWESSTGWWEKLQHWGWQDIEFHNRLLRKYNFGGNLTDFGINFYHLMFDKKGLKHPNFKMNPQINSLDFEANDSSWGLNGEQLEILK